MEKCLADIQSWMIDERLLINDDKTGVLYLTLRGILMLKVKARTRHAYTLKQKIVKQKIVYFLARLNEIN